LVLLAAAVLALALAGAPSLLGRADELRARLPSLGQTQRTPGTQSAAQISATEFRGLAVGLTTGALRGRVGAPEDTSTARLEGLRVECWYYGVAGARGVYQLCFSDGRLSSKLRYNRAL
jgi:hypothetical protein